VWDWQLCEALNVAAAVERSSDFDVIHSHAYQFALPFVRLSSAPIVQTHHVMPDADLARAYAARPDAPLIALSRYHARSLSPAVPTTVIHPGLPTITAASVGCETPYLLYLGRLMRQKGLIEAIEVARRAGMRLVVAGPKNDAYDEARPSFDAGVASYVGPVDAAVRDELLGGAAALVYPLLRGEPFGLVLIEAMLAGTPVLAFDCGAVPEIVDHGLTGYLGPDVASLVANVPAALALDRSTIRRVAERRFGVAEMVSRHEDAYRAAAGRAQ